MKPKLTESEKRRIRKRIKAELDSNPPKSIEELRDFIIKEFAHFVAEMVMKEAKKITHNFTRMDELEKRWPVESGGFVKSERS